MTGTRWQALPVKLPKECRRLGELGLLGIPQGYRLSRQQLSASRCMTRWPAGRPRGSENFGVLSHGITVMTGQDDPALLTDYLRGAGSPAWRLNGTEGESLIYGPYSLVVLLMLLRRVEDGDLDLGENEVWLRRNLRARWARLALGASARPPRTVVYRVEDRQIERRANLDRYTEAFVHLPAARSALAMKETRPDRSNRWIEASSLHPLLAGACGYPWTRGRRPEAVSFEAVDWLMSLAAWATHGAGFRRASPAGAWGLREDERQVLRSWVDHHDLNAALRLLQWLEPYPHVEGCETRGQFFESGSFFWYQNRTKNHVKRTQGSILVSAYDVTTSKCWRLAPVDPRKRGSRQGFAQYLTGEGQFRMRAADRPWIHWRLPRSFGAEAFQIVATASGWRVEPG